MPNYVVNKNPQRTGEHELHLLGCIYQPDVKNSIEVGYHPNCRSALEQAKKIFANTDGCAYCCPECHTK